MKGGRIDCKVQMNLLTLRYNDQDFRKITNHLDEFIYRMNPNSIKEKKDVNM